MTAPQIVLAGDTAKRRRKPNCLAPKCHRESYSRGLCGVHIRISREGLSLWATSVAEARRLANVRISGECWVWQGHLSVSGYGKVGGGVDGKSIPIHRWFYEHFISRIPDELHLDHLCRNPACVNPKHLEPVTPAENTRRGFIARGYTDERETCANGHPWIPENLFVARFPVSDGFSYRNCCRLCRNAFARALKAKKAAARRALKTNIRKDAA